MRQLLLLTLLGLVGISGCQSVVKPFEPRTERADDPMLSAGEQKRKARYLHAFPDRDLGPRSNMGEPDFLGPHQQ